MADSAVLEPEYHCENCIFLDDAPVPSECRKGYGQVAYLHQICENFKLRCEIKKDD
jgi:hypothetical protein